MKPNKMHSKLAWFSALLLIAVTGCATRPKTNGDASGSSPPDAPQVKAVLSPQFREEHISRIAIVSTKFRDDPVTSDAPQPYQGAPDYRNIHGAVPYQSRSGQYRSDLENARNRSLSEGDSRASLIEDVFIRFLIGKGYSYASRKEVKEIVLEQSFQHSGLTDSDAVRMGKLLNVPAVLMITVSNLGQVDTFEGNLLTFPFQLAGALLMPNSGSSCLMRCSMTARLISTQTGEVLWLASLDDFCIKQKHNEITSVLQKATELIARSFPART